MALLQAALARVLLDEQEGVVEATIVCSKPGLEEAVKKICEDDRFSTAYTCPYVFQTTQGLNWRVRYPAGSDFAATSPGVPDSTVLPVRWIQSGPAQDELEFDLLYASVHSERGGRWVDYRWSRFRLTFASGRNTGMTRTDIRTWRLPKKMFAEFGISEEQAREMRRARLRPVQAIADSILTSLDVDRSHLFPALRDECSTYVVETGFYVRTQGTSRQVLEGPTITIRKSDLKVLEVAWSSDRTPPH